VGAEARSFRRYCKPGKIYIDTKYCNYIGVANMPNEKGGENMSKSRTWGKKTIAWVAAAVLALATGGVLTEQVGAHVPSTASGTLSLAPHSGLQYWFRVSNAGPYDRTDVFARLYDHTILVTWQEGWASIGPCWRHRVRVALTLMKDGVTTGSNAGHWWDTQPGVVNWYRWTADLHAKLLGFRETILIGDRGYIGIT
jgi:hypothetical protein